MPSRSPLVRLACLLALLLAIVAVATPRDASARSSIGTYPYPDASLTIGTYPYYDCKGELLATCWVTSTCGSGCNGSIAGWCTHGYTEGTPDCSETGD